MWLLTPDGFYSVVQKQGESDLCIRARTLDDLVRLRGSYLPTMSDPIETPNGDYPFRSWASHQDFADALRRIALDIDYSNFKDEVGSRQGWERAGVYTEVWYALQRLQREDEDL